MFYASAVGCPNFDKMEANPICKQVGRRTLLWQRRSQTRMRQSVLAIVLHAAEQERLHFAESSQGACAAQIDWDESHELYKAWDEGRTG